MSSYVSSYTCRNISSSNSPNRHPKDCYQGGWSRAIKLTRDVFERKVFIDNPYTFKLPTGAEVGDEIKYFCGSPEERKKRPPNSCFPTKASVVRTVDIPAPPDVAYERNSLRISKEGYRFWVTFPEGAEAYKTYTFKVPVLVIMTPHNAKQSLKSLTLSEARMIKAKCEEFARDMVDSALNMSNLKSTYQELLEKINDDDKLAQVNKLEGALETAKKALTDSQTRNRKLETAEDDLKKMKKNWKALVDGIRQNDTKSLFPFFTSEKEKKIKQLEEAYDCLLKAEQDAISERDIARENYERTLSDKEGEIRQFKEKQQEMQQQQNQLEQERDKFEERLKKKDEELRVEQRKYTDLLENQNISKKDEQFQEALKMHAEKLKKKEEETCVLHERMKTGSNLEKNIGELREANKVLAARLRLHESTTFPLNAEVAREYERFCSVSLHDLIMSRLATVPENSNIEYVGGALRFFFQFCDSHVNDRLACVRSEIERALGRTQSTGQPDADVRRMMQNNFKTLLCVGAEGVPLQPWDVTGMGAQKLSEISSHLEHNEQIQTTPAPVGPGRFWTNALKENRARALVEKCVCELCVIMLVVWLSPLPLELCIKELDRPCKYHRSRCHMLDGACKPNELCVPVAPRLCCGELEYSTTNREDKVKIQVLPLNF